MKHKSIITAFFTAVFFTFLTFAIPPFGILDLGRILGPWIAEAGLQATDLTAPTVPVEWARLAGREGEVYLEVPSNQLGGLAKLPRNPAPVVIGKFDPIGDTARQTRRR